ncbi:MAG: precorrin-6y C5,15-methyltransferase (decarboxylating) subunit CbiE [Firmicutes bacterium]|nr:precorrin-6y C5,15-methyltransferase (decarboxylating) subunit CbiE [Bacillota bacterium]
MNKISVVGLGPGHPDYISPRAKEVIKESEIIIGGKRNIESINTNKKEVHLINSNLNKIIDYIKKNYNKKKIAVIVSGDTGFYSLLKFLKRYIESNKIEVIPGISSMQYMFSKIGETWDDAYISSLHGRKEDFIKMVKDYKKVGFLTDNKLTPNKISEKLLKNNLNNRTVYVGENLSYDNEKITKGSPKKISKLKDFNMCVVVIIDD